MVKQTTSNDGAQNKLSALGRHDGLTRILHWVFAVIIIYVSITGYSLTWITNHHLRFFLAHLNMSLSTILIPLFLLRVIWKFARNNPPPLPIDSRQLKLALAVHDFLYLTIFAVLTTGFLMVPQGYKFFDLIPVPTPFKKGPITELFAHVHSICNVCLAGLVFLHVMGVIYHSVFKRINILSRML